VVKINRIIQVQVVKLQKGYSGCYKMVGFCEDCTNARVSQ